MLKVIERVAPGLLQLLEQRSDILTIIKETGPVGRRLLSKKVGLSERILRSEIELLKQQELIVTSSVGMTITSLGNQTLEELDSLLNRQSYFQEMEEMLAQQLGIQKCTIKQNQSLHSMADLTVKIIDRLLPEGDSKIAVMGGSTLRSIAEAFDQSLSNNRTLQFIPARGGTGEQAMLQANAIADLMATRTNGTSRMLYAPEHVSSETHSLLTEEPEIKETLEILSKSILVIFSIGSADQMAKRIGLGPKSIEELKASGAVAEAFGEFINRQGQVVYKLARVGLSPESLRQIPNLLAVAGGEEKAEAIKAYCKIAPSHTYLVTDEACANKILNGETQ